MKIIKIIVLFPIWVIYKISVLHTSEIPSKDTTLNNFIPKCDGTIYLASIMIYLVIYFIINLWI